MSVWVRQQGLPRKPDVNDPTWLNSGTDEPILYRELSAEMLRTDEQLEDEDDRTVEASHCWSADSVEAVCDGIEPKKSSDDSIGRLTFWDHRGTKEWVEMTFNKPKKISKSSVYWFDDTGKGQCRIPSSWRLSYLENGEWLPIKTDDFYDVVPNRYNVVEFAPIETKTLRLDVKLQENFSGGILEWKVE